ncbi:MAG: hypothetical protein LC797_03160, partial [Chloroflexi bacterium]|nr:hypothetical protein [Chloroflexota bacterium]
MCYARSAELTEFTAYGYLRNPAHQATSWGQTSGGNLRTAPDVVGVEWVYPVGRDPSTRVGLHLETVVDGQPARTRTEFEAIGLTSRYHSCLIFGFDWQIDEVQVEARYFLASDDALAARIVLANGAAAARDTTVSLVGSVDSATVNNLVLTTQPCAHVVVGHRHLNIRLAPGERQKLVAVLA